MTTIPGPVEVANTIKAKNNLNFPVVEDTDIWGGFQVVATTTERDAIPSGKLKVGMRVVVQADGNVYELTSTSPMAWAIDSGGGATDGDKGDITVSGGGTTWTIDAAVVSNSKLANVATSTFKGRTTAGTGSPEDLTGTQATALLDVFTTSLKGLAPASGGGTSNYLRADGTWATPPDTSVTDGDKGDITVSGSGATWTIDTGVVSNSKLANVATATFKGRTTAGAGSPEDLTGTQATALLDVFSSTLKGLAPASGGGTSNYLRADGTWTTIPTSSLTGTLGVANGGTGTSTAFTPGSIVFAGTGGVYSQNNATLFWDNGTNRLGIGTATPNEALTVNGVLSLAEGTAPSATASFGKFYALSADGRPYFLDDGGQAYNLTLDRFNTLTPAASVAIDTSPALPVFNSLTLNQNTAFTTTNLGAGRSASVRVVGDASTRTLTFPAGWTWLGSGAPTSLAANDIGYLSLTAYGATDADVVAAWSYKNMPAAVTGSGVATRVAFWDGTSSLSSDANLYWDDTNNRLGLLTAAPSSTLSVGASSQFQVNSTGNLTKVNNVTYSFPASQATVAGQVLTNDSSGNLTWSSPSSLAGFVDGAVTTPSIFFTADTDTGIYRPTTNQLAVTTAGVQRLLIKDTEAVFNDVGLAYDFRVAGDADINAFVVQASTDRVGIGTASPGAKLTVAAGALASGAAALAISGTLSSAVATQRGVTMFLTGAGSGAQQIEGVIAGISGGGYTGTGTSIGANLYNESVGTGNQPFQNQSGNFGVRGQAYGASATGHNVGFYATAQSALRNYGFVSVQTANSQANGYNVGIATSAHNAAASGVRVGGFFSINTTFLPAEPTLTSAALIADNTSATDPIFIARDGGLPVFTIADGGAVTATSTISASNLSGTNTGDQTITLTSDVTGSGTGSFATTIAAGVVTNSKLANVATATFKGRTTAGTGSPEDLTAAQATALLDVFSSTLKGLAPASGGGTTNYLRADGTWTTVATSSLTGTLGVANGGTGISSYAVGDLLYADTASSLARLADVATGNVLRSGGVGVAPAWGKVALATDVSGTLPVANGGTGASTAFTPGSLVFAGASGVYSQDNINLFWDDASNRLGILTATPASTFSVGATSQFQVNSTGNLTKVNNVTYSFPSAQATVAGQVLSNDTAGNLTWVVPPALKTPISTKTANYTITTADGTIIVNAASGPVTITLPSAASATEYHFTVKKVDTSSNTVTIAGTIDGTTNYVLYSQYEAVRVQSDGSVYWII